MSWKSWSARPRARLRPELADHVVRVDIPADLPLLFLDGLLMEQVLMNLLENAAHYTPAGTRIDISAAVPSSRPPHGTRRGDYAVIRVADNGPGLPAGNVGRVFDKFFRGSTTPTADGRHGAGLGLSICKAIVERMTGRSKR